MARLAEDTSSWKASGIQRRDFRSTINGPEVQRTNGSKKNTRRWCKGVEGREHVLDMRVSNHGRMVESLSGAPCSDFTTLGWHCNHERYCMVCGKVLEWTLGETCPTKNTP